MGFDWLLAGLNQQQHQAVTYEGGPLLVLAGAGSGKTRVLTHRAAWLVATGRAKPSQLLLLTFTNKAANEMKERLFRLLAPLSGQQANHRSLVAGLFAGTFHSFCAYILRRDGEKIGIPNSFVIYDEKDQLALIKDLIKKLDLSEKRFKPASVKAVIESAKNDLVTPTLFSESVKGGWYQTVALIYQQYQKQLAQSNALDFNDLLMATVDLFKREPVILEKYQERYRFILVDEYQDTNRSQYVLTKLLAKKYGQLTVVGDAAQAIYGWRGADYRNLMSLTRDFSDIKIINLEQNYRSTQTILDAAYAVIAKNEKHPVLKLFTQNGSGEKIMVYRASSEIDEAEFVAEKIKQLVDFQGIDPTQVAVLYRTNAQSRTFEESFIRHSLPYILIGGVKFYERAEIKDVLALLRVFHNSKDQIAWQRIEKNLGKRRRLKVEQFLAEHENQDWTTKRLLEKIVLASGYLEKFDPDNEDDYRRLENIKELASVAEQFPDLGAFLENVALVQQEYSAQEKEKSRLAHEAVKLMTLHSSKGLEFEVVFIVGLEEGLLPHSRSLEELEQLEEERRLCYVGMTRAKKKLFLTHASRRLYFGRTSYQEPSRFLDDIPEHLVIREGDDFDWEDDIIS